ncbi:MAG TPA: nucleoside deaminase [Dictyoglomaceae bacterium]|nr:nucleoside deaminase [Dictyoglomaceae bacterium]HPU44272.1 nucleoside deaminase [Dictyoglomaceae bacterium]
MKESLKEARKAFRNGEVPVGAVVVLNNEIIARGYNVRENKKDPILHAEIEVLRKASKKLKNWRLNDCTLYVTLEPCLMCFGAILQARIKRVVYGAPNIEEGFTNFILEEAIKKKWDKIEVFPKVLEEDCKEIIKDFFETLRSSPS